MPGSGYAAGGPAAGGSRRTGHGPLPEGGAPILDTRPVWSARHDDLAALRRAALAAADPAAAVARSLRLGPGFLRSAMHEFPLAPADRIWMIALGKASPGMARAALDVVGPRLAGGIVAHPHGGDSGSPWPPGVRVFSASHPLPDAGSLAAGEAALRLLQGMAPGDVVLVLVSGGGSALFEALLPGVTLDGLRAVTGSLMASGADIVELNVVRRALSRVKAGGLARAAGSARVLTLILSDVVGDRLEAIASGPTIEAPVRAAEARAVLERRGLAPGHAAILRALEAAESPAAPPPPSAARRSEILVSNRTVGEAACAAARGRGFDALLLTDRLQGEAREIGRMIGGIARGLVEAELPLRPPCCLVLGGETTVTVRGAGRGGRNLELALGAAIALEGCPDVVVASFATDGLDGSSGAAGAFATGETLALARSLGLDPYAALAASDSEPFFRRLGDLWITGPSGTNVNDLVVVLAYASVLAHPERPGATSASATEEPFP